MTLLFDTAEVIKDVSHLVGFIKLEMKWEKKRKSHKITISVLSLAAAQIMNSESCRVRPCSISVASS